MRFSRSSFKSNFHLSRKICHVPRPNVVTGIARSQRCFFSVRPLAEDVRKRPLPEMKRLQNAAILVSLTRDSPALCTPILPVQCLRERVCESTTTVIKRRKVKMRHSTYKNIIPSRPRARVAREQMACFWAQVPSTSS